MGTFVLGVLVGWLAEWLFFSFWVKDGPKDTGAMKKNLQAKMDEIRVLKQELKDAKSSGGAATKAKAEVTNIKKAVKNKAAPKKKVASTANKTASTAAKTSSASAAKKPVTAKVAATKKATTAKKPAAKKAATKKAAPKKATASKTTAKKMAPKKAAPKKAASKAKAGGDDLTKLSGIGPSMAGTLKELGIDSYKKLAATNDDILRDMLEASGARLNNNKEAMDSWNEQAELADKGDFAGLKKLQESLNK